MKTRQPGSPIANLLRTVLLVLSFWLAPVSTRAADLSVTYAGSSDQAVIVSFFDRHTEGNNLVGTLQIQNTSGTWVYIQQDVSNLNPVAMPYTVYLLGPDAIKTFSNFPFPQGAYLKLTATTVLGADFSGPNEQRTALMGAFILDLITRGLLTFSLPPDAFDQPPVGEVVEPLFDTLVSNADPKGALVIAIKNRSVTDTLSALLDMASDSKDLASVLASLLKKYVTADQVQSAFGVGAQLLDLPEKASLLTDLTARTFSAPTITWSRLDVVAKTQAARIDSVSPPSLTTRPVPQTQSLTIHGSGFTTATRLVFTIGSALYPSRPERLQFIDANTLKYNIAVGSAVGTWSVRLADGTGSATFQVQAASTGLYTITPLSGPHGSITPNSTLTKAGAESQTFVATPQDATFTVDSWYVDGTLIPNTGNRFTLADIQAPHTVFVTFKPITPTGQTGSLTVTLEPAGALAAGAQWQVDGGTYHNSGDIVTGLTPGTHTVACKAIAGYTAPTSHYVTITGGAVASDPETYTAIQATTYTLTLNQGGDMGHIVNQPFGAGSGNIYNQGAVVELTANAKAGYHFVSWGGDASGSGSQNPTTITMNGNKTVTANFALGDPNLGTVIVTIEPPEAVAAGVKWGWNADDYRDSGTSVTTWPATYILTLHPVDGWLGPSALWATVTAGQTTNYPVTFTPDPTPGFLTVTLSPPDAVAAGAKWHVNGGTAQGSGTSVPLPPGGSYSVTFDPVPGWTVPPSQTVAVQRAQTTVVNGTYTPPAGQPVIAAIHPGFGALAGGTALTIEGVNFTAPATVLIGGKPATSVSVLSVSQIACFTPSNSVYGTMPVIVQTPGGSATNLNGFTYGAERGNGIELVTSLGGRAYGVAVQDNYAYVGEGSSLLVLNISTPSSPSLVGRLAMPGKVMDIALFGQYAYVADADAGLQVVDVSNPSAPALKGFYATPGWANGISILGGRAYLAGGAGLEILDLGNPAYPALLSASNIGRADDVAVHVSTNGVLAYVCLSGGYLCVVDVSQPLSPISRGRVYTGGGFAPSVAASGNKAFVASAFGGLRLLDVSNYDAPVDLGAAAGVDVLSVASANNLVYAAGPFSFSIVSYSDVGQTVVGQNFTIKNTGYNIAVSGTRAYLAGGETGFEIVDVSNSSNPSVLTTFSDSGQYGALNSVESFGNYLYANVGNSIKVFNVLNSALPTQVGQYAVGNLQVRQIVATNSCAYVIGSETRILSLANPASPTTLSTIPTGDFSSYKGVVSGNLLFLVGNDSAWSPRFMIADVSAPTSPKTRGNLGFPSLGGTGPARALAIWGDKAVVGVDAGQLKILDISNINMPLERGALTNVGLPSGVAISADGRYAYVIDGNANSSLRIIDVGNWASPSIVTNVPLDATVGNAVAVQGDLIYAVTYWGVYVFDAVNPTAPVLIRSYAVNGASSVSLATDWGRRSETIYLACSDAGLVILKFKDTDTPQVFITGPTFSPAYTNMTGTINLGGSASDNIGVTRVTWSNTRGGGGEVAPPFDNWYVSGISLQPGTNALTVTAFDAAGNRGSNTLTVIYEAPPQDQTITFPAISDRTFGDPPFPLVAVASSGLPVSFSVLSGPATVERRLAAGLRLQNRTASGSTPARTLANGSSRLESGAPANAGDGTWVLTVTGAGAVTVRASQDGNESYYPASPVDVTFTVAKADQAIAFGALPDKSAGDAPFALSATASSGLPVSFDLVSGPAALDTNNVVTLQGGGVVTVSAWQPGSLNYNAAVTVQRSFNVAKMPQSITFGPLSRQTVGDAPFPLAACASSGLPVTLKLLDGPAVLSGNILTVADAGQVTVRASQPGNALYAPAADVDQAFVVVSGLNRITDYGQGADGQFHFTFVGEYGRQYVIEFSTDLATWTPVVTNTVDALGNLEFSDASAASRAASFYRIKTP